MIDLTTNYLGLKLKNPVVVSASPLTEKLENFERLQDAGASAIVMYSLFEEQIEAESENLDAAMELGTNSYAEATTYLPDMPKYHIGPDRYIDLLHKAKRTVDIPVIASLNGNSRGGWIRYAEHMEEAGAGADGVVIFNRFYQPDFDLEELEVTPNLVLSSPHELRLRLHWAAILYHQVETYIAITGGVHDSTDVLKSMMAGAHVAMITSALLKYGIEHIGVVLAGMERWMEEHEYQSIKQMRGSMSLVNIENPTAFLRGNYLKMLGSYKFGDAGSALPTY